MFCAVFPVLYFFKILLFTLCRVEGESSLWGDLFCLVFASLSRINTVFSLLSMKNFRSFTILAGILYRTRYIIKLIKVGRINENY